MSNIQREFAKALWIAVIQTLPATTTLADFAHWLTSFMETEGWSVEKTENQ